MGHEIIISLIAMVTAVVTLFGNNIDTLKNQKPKSTERPVHTAQPAEPAQPAAEETYTEPSAEQPAQPEPSKPQKTEITPMDSDPVYIAYQSLSYAEKSVYTELCACIDNNETGFTFYDTDEQTIINAYKAVIADHPEFFWMGGGYSYQKTIYPDSVKVEFKPTIMTRDKMELQAKRREFENRAARILSIQSGISDYDKLLYIHDYIVDNTLYDYSALGAIESGGQKGRILNASTAYGCLAENKALCSGYSAAFQLLAQQLGIPCGRISGVKVGGGNHEWNYVLIDGEYYFIDVTWDDPSSVSDEHDNKSYEFFCITSAELNKTHIIGKDQYAPLCVSEKYNYYVYNGLYVPRYDFSAVSAILRRNAHKNVSIRFADANETQKAINDLFANNKVFDYTDKTTLTYSTGVAGEVLTIYFE